MTERNDSTDTTPNLPATPESGPPARLHRSRPDTRAPSPGAPGQPDLADRDRRRHWEWRMRRQLAEAEHWMQMRVKHPDGGERTVAETQADEEQQRRQINRETALGSLKHRRLPRWQHWIPKVVLFFDFVLLLYFFAGITNVNWQSPVSMNTAFATALSGMVTVLAYGFLAFTGHRMRSYKDHAGTVHLDGVDDFTKAAFGTALAVILVLATLMFLRIRSEVTAALGSEAGVTALVIPLAVAVVSAVANYLVVLIHAFDGSDEVHRLNKLATATRRLSRRVHRLRKRAADQAYR
jgi:hypothetical protein